jgi:hypothetical protein
MSDNTVIKPTRQSILSGISSLLLNATATDVLLFYFSGHGTQVPDANKDEADGLDEALYTLDSKIITDDEIYSIFCNTKAQVYLFLDCCHSGTLCDLEYNIQPYVQPKIYKLWLEQKQSNSRICLFSGCMDPQTSADASFPKTLNEYESNGAFTYCLLQALKDSNYVITNKILLSNMYIKLRTLGFTQIPQLSCSKLEMFEKGFLG